MAEIRIGYDSLIVANSVAADSLNLTLGQLWRAVAGRVLVGGRLVPNPYQSWSDIDPSLPRKRITLLGPSVGHGTRDAFVELVMEPSCRVALAGIAISPEEREACTRVRSDGHWVDVENIELTLGKLASNRDAWEYSRIRISSSSHTGFTPGRSTASSPPLHQFRRVRIRCPVPCSFT